MSIAFTERASDSAYVESISWGHTLSAGQPIRPAEIHWHMVIVRLQGHTHVLSVGPLSASGMATYGEGAEILWIKFKLGTFMPHLPPVDLLDREAMLPEAGINSFWLKGAAWELPTSENVETFVSRLLRQDVLAHDPLVSAALADHTLDVSPRTLRHHFLRATGQTQGHIRQMLRAQQAAEQLRHGRNILDVVFDAGYYDQPHLTRSLKRFIGFTPAQLASNASAV